MPTKTIEPISSVDLSDVTGGNGRMRTQQPATSDYLRSLEQRRLCSLANIRPGDSQDRQNLINAGCEELYKPSFKLSIYP